MGVGLGGLSGGLLARAQSGWDGDQVSEGMAQGALWRREGDPDGPVVAKVVEEVFVRVGQVLHVHVRGRIIRTTPEHPFWVVNKARWVAAGELEVGDVFLSHDGQLVEVEDLLDTGE